MRVMMKSPVTRMKRKVMLMKMVMKMVWGCRQEQPVPSVISNIILRLSFDHHRATYLSRI